MSTNVQYVCLLQKSDDPDVLHECCEHGKEDTCDCSYDCDYIHWRTISTTLSLKTAMNRLSKLELCDHQIVIFNLSDTLNVYPYELSMNRREIVFEPITHEDDKFNDKESDIFYYAMCNEIKHIQSQDYPALKFEIEY